MKTQHRLAEALRELMSEMPLDDISVSTLTDKCGLSRKAFYYHFHDIFDLLTQVFLDERIPKIDTASSLKNMVEIIYTYYTKNSKFVDATLSSAGKELFQEFLYNNVYKTILRFVNENYLGKVLPANDKKSVARFYALGYAHSIVYYLSTYKNKTLLGLKNCFLFDTEENLGKALQHLAEVRELTGKIKIGSVNEL